MASLAGGVVTLISSFAYINKVIKPIEEDIEHITDEILSLGDNKKNINRNSNDLLKLNKMIISQSETIKSVINKQNSILFSLKCLTETVIDIQRILYAFDKEKLKTKFIPDKVATYILKSFDNKVDTYKKRSKNFTEAETEENHNKEQITNKNEIINKNEILDALSDL